MSRDFFFSSQPSFICSRFLTICAGHSGRGLSYRSLLGSDYEYRLSLMHISRRIGCLLVWVLSCVAALVSLILFARWTHGYTAAVVAKPQVSSGLYLHGLARIPLSHSPRQNEGLNVDRKRTKRPSTQKCGLGVILPSTAETFLRLSL